MRRIVIAFNPNALERYGYAIDEGQGFIQHFGYFKMMESWPDDNDGYMLVKQKISIRDKFIEEEKRRAKISDYVDTMELYTILEHFLEMAAIECNWTRPIKMFTKKQLLIDGSNFSELPHRGEERQRILDTIAEVGESPDSLFDQVIISDCGTAGYLCKWLRSIFPFKVAQETIKDATACAIETAVRQNALEQESWTLTWTELLIKTKEALDAD